MVDDFSELPMKAQVKGRITEKLSYIPVKTTDKQTTVVVVICEPPLTPSDSNLPHLGHNFFHIWDF